MRLYPPGALLQGRHWSDDLLPALAAECLSRLHRGAASIAEHLFLHAEIVNAEILDAKIVRQSYRHNTLANRQYAEYV
jgi:hypothetical protein